jgi:hypothetical protein
VRLTTQVANYIHIYIAGLGLVVSVRKSGLKHLSPLYNSECRFATINIVRLRYATSSDRAISLCLET